MKKEARVLLWRSLDSLVLSVKRFNCPWDCGRQETMLLLLDRAFELLLKAAILHRGGRIPDQFEEKYGYLRTEVMKTLYSFLERGIQESGMARVRCEESGHDFFVAYSCRCRVAT